MFGGPPSLYSLYGRKHLEGPDRFSVLRSAAVGKCSAGLMKHRSSGRRRTECVCFTGAGWCKRSPAGRTQGRICFVRESHFFLILLRVGRLGSSVCLFPWKSGVRRSDHLLSITYVFGDRVFFSSRKWGSLFPLGPCPAVVPVRVRRRFCFTMHRSLFV